MCERWRFGRTPYLGGRPGARNRRSRPVDSVSRGTHVGQSRQARTHEDRYAWTRPRRRTKAPSPCFWTPRPPRPALASQSRLRIALYLRAVAVPSGTPALARLRAALLQARAARQPFEDVWPRAVRDSKPDNAMWTTLHDEAVAAAAWKRAYECQPATRADLASARRRRWRTASRSRRSPMPKIEGRMRANRGPKRRNARKCGAFGVGDTGLEPVTSALSRRRSPS